MDVYRFVFGCIAIGLLALIMGGGVLQETTNLSLSTIENVNNSGMFLVGTGVVVLAVVTVTPILKNR